VTEPQRIYLATITTVEEGEPAEAIAFNVPPDAGADDIKAALAAAEAEKVAAQVRESRRLRRLFLEDERR
jgi:hypothetical protein